MKADNEALEYFAHAIRDGRLVYVDGEIWRVWEERIGWLSPLRWRRAERRTTNNYLMLRARSPSARRVLYVMAHRAVWAAFRGDIADGVEVNHINGSKVDNRIENLELATPAENRAHARATGLTRYARAERSGRGVLSDDDVAQIRELLADGRMLQREIAARFGVRPNHISRINTGARRAIPEAA